MQEAPMQETKKKGLSKGFKVGMVILGIIFVLVVSGGFICYSQWNTLMRNGISLLVIEVKTEIAINPVEGVDTVTFNAVADGFIEILETQESFDLTQERIIGFQLQTISFKIEKNNLYADDVDFFMQGMVRLYPGLRDSIREEPVSEGISGE